MAFPDPLRKACRSLEILHFVTAIQNLLFIIVNQYDIKPLHGP